MPAAFSRTLRSLAAESPRRALFGVLALAASLSVWVAWFLLARVRVYTTSEVGRVEVEREVHVLQPAVDGRVVAAPPGIGEEVVAGAPVVVLDAEAQRLALDGRRREALATAAQRDELRREMAHREGALRREIDGWRASVAEARARAQEAEQDALIAVDATRRASALRSSEAISEQEMLRTAGKERKLRAAAAARAAHVSRVEAELAMRVSAGRAGVDALRREEAELTGAIDMARLAATALENAIDQHVVRSPVSGTLAELAPLRPGAYVRAGDKLGTILPRSEMRIVAEFLPASSIGRIRPGMPARLRLDGFPWTQFGSFGAVVTNVAAEVRQGRVRVEAALAGEGAPQVPQQHGLPGALEVEIERASPAQLVLRTVSRTFRGGRPGSAPLLSESR